MQVSGNNPFFLDHLYQFAGEVFRMGTFKANPFDGVFLCSQYLQQLGKVDNLTFLFKVITVHVLSKQGYFFHSLGIEEGKFLDNVFNWTGYLSSTYIGDNAICTKIVAAIHDGNK
jgi:hypothetical protein